jgi:hypothetical protein
MGVGSAWAAFPGGVETPDWVCRGRARRFIHPPLSARSPILIWKIYGTAALR